MKKRTILFVLTVLSSLCALAHYYVPRFDPNQDGTSDIIDVTDLIDFILSGVDVGLNADVDRNGRVSIADVTAMMDYLLNPDYFDLPQYEPAYPDFEIPDGAEIYEVNGVHFAMMPIDTVDEAGNLVHKFSLGVTEVTIELWQTVLGYNPVVNWAYFMTPRWPVSHVNWYEANMFIDSLNALTGMEFRLPLLDEWEFAARGGLFSHNYKYAGSDNIDEVGWYQNHMPYGFEVSFNGCPVGLLRPNELGIYDMTGNVSEWCIDAYVDYHGLYAGIVGGDACSELKECLISKTITYCCEKTERGLNILSPWYHGLRLAL